MLRRKAFYRRNLPHLQRDYKRHFVTFSVQKQPMCSLAEIMDAVKGASAHMINHMLARRGRVWQEESFDHVLRTSEKLEEKIAYILNNPVRKGLVGSPQEYRWL
jgi:hypothetical protein